FVAIKMILAGPQAGPAQLARFRLEAEAIARIRHPNIVQVFEVSESQERLFFSMEYVEGGSLTNKIHGGPLSTHDAARLVETLARGIHAAHLEGLVHRDLKPANVLLTVSGELKIADFGLVKQIDQAAGQTQSGAILGTPSYMAPEQASGKSKE